MKKLRAKFTNIFHRSAREPGQALRPGDSDGQGEQPETVAGVTTFQTPGGRAPHPSDNQRQDKFGLFLFPSKTPAEGAAPPIRTYLVDIVAIHGITGDAYDTWAAPDGTLWLRDLLSEDLPGARVFSYGYDAGVFFTKGTGDVETYARTLLESLKQKRQEELSRRPIIFVCHSMGGLVAKQAIVTAILKDVNYGDIRRSCTGIVFLGTPHRGSTQTTFPSLLANIANIGTPVFSRFIGSARTDLIDNLKRDAPNLQILSLQFADQLLNIKIASFIEQDITPPARVRIVDGVTGIIGSGGERIVDMQGCDHRSICRFNRRSNNYELVVGILKEWAAVATAGQTTTIQGLLLDPTETCDTACQDTLSFSGMSWRMIDLLDRASPGSCSWIFQHHEYLEWTSQPKGPLWVKGKPGAGKSTLMESLVEHYHPKATRSEIVFLHFFFNAFGPYLLQKSASGLYRALLYQLMEQAPSSVKQFTAFCRRRMETNTETDPDKFWHDNEKNLIRMYLNKGLENLARRNIPVVIIIDAVDEAVIGTAEEIVTYLHQLDKKLRSLGLDFRLCISCRHYPIIPVTERHRIVVEKENMIDIAAYTETQFSNQRILLRSSYEKLGILEKLKQDIIDRSRGIFLWVSLTIPAVRDELNKAPKTLDSVYASLDEVRTRLGEIYADILRNVIRQDDRFDAYALLKWATQAHGPLHLQKLIKEVDFSDAYSVPPTVSAEELEEELPKIEIRVGNFSGGLMEVTREENGRYAMFIHPSVKAYLLEHGLGHFRQLLGNPPSPSLQGSQEDRLVQTSPVESSAALRLDIVKPPEIPETTRYTETVITMDPTSRNSEKYLPRHTTTAPLTHSRDRIRPKARKQVGDTDDVVERYHQLNFEPSISKQKAADFWFQKFNEHCLPLVAKSGHSSGKNVRVAILNDGVDLGHPLISPHRDQIKYAWTQPGAAGNWSLDNKKVLHGTYMVSLLLRMVPFAKILVAQVVPFDRDLYLSRLTIAKAIHWAVAENADVISIPIKLPSWDEKVDHAMAIAEKRGTVVLAAGEPAYPVARLQYPIICDAADGYGNSDPDLHLNVGTEQIFTFLGEGIRLHLQNAPGSSIILSGSSVATTVATAIAALVLEYIQQPHVRQHLSPEIHQVLHGSTGMRTIFEYMTSSRGNTRDHRHYVVPWKLLDKNLEDHGVVMRIQRVMGGSLKGSEIPMRAPVATSGPGQNGTGRGKEKDDEGDGDGPQDAAATMDPFSSVSIGGGKLVLSD